MQQTMRRGAGFDLHLTNWPCSSTLRKISATGFYSERTKPQLENLALHVDRSKKLLVKHPSLWFMLSPTSMALRPASSSLKLAVRAEGIATSTQHHKCLGSRREHCIESVQIHDSVEW